MADALADLIETYHGLNVGVVEEVREEPSALEFMRWVAKNRPVVMRGVASDWTASRRWDAAYLAHVMGDEKVAVAVTPLGNADAVVEEPDGTLVFVEPHETFEPFRQFLDHVRQQAKHSPASSARPGPHGRGNVKYAQTQNDNLRHEYAALYPDVPKDIPFARVALGQGADAINFWLGDDRSVTSLHKDNYENVYVQIRGQKHFVLLPPVEMPCVNEQMLPRGRYIPSAAEHVKASPDGSAAAEPELVVGLDFSGYEIPVATWDPDIPAQRTTPYSRLSRPLRVTLDEGDMLYLPAMWYHKVSETVGDEGFVCAVNYWYDMDFSGGFWAHNSFVRDVAIVKRQAQKTDKEEREQW